MHYTMRIVIYLALGTILACCLPAFAQVGTDGEVEDMTGVASRELSAPGFENVVWTSRKFDWPGASFLRLHLELQSAPDDTNVGFHVRVIDGDGGELKIPGSELLARGSLWTRPVSNGSQVQIVADPTPTGLVLAIPEVARHVKSGQFLSPSGDDDREMITEVEDPALVRAARAVAKISYVSGGALRSCTGFLVDDKHLLTNEHCVNTDAICATAAALFDFDQRGGRFGESFSCRRVVDASRELDAALLELEGNPGAERGTLSIDPRRPTQSEALVIVQHPAGQPKQVSRDGCLVTQPVADGVSGPVDFAHRCDTLGGSSGSPVLDAGNTVIGLHHFGMDDTGPWSEDNRAVRAEEFGEWLEQNLSTASGPGRTSSEE